MTPIRLCRRSAVPAGRVAQEGPVGQVDLGLEALLTERLRVNRLPAARVLAVLAREVLAAPAARAGLARRSL